MGYISFYRKWRPQNFSEIIAQEYIVKTLQNAISKNRISHCYIFCGPRGTGKTSLARIFSKGLNCINGPTPRPCNKCDNCISISAGTNVDVIEIDAASNRGINEIRELREKVKYLPANLRKKVYIIDEVHMLTTEAFNALLKVLEEPPGHVIFIMATTEPHQVIPTIMSRCQRFDFEPIPIDRIRQRVRDISSSENIEINDSAINLIAKYADGSLRDADGILEQLSSFGDSKITVDDVSSLLGIIDQEMLFELTNIIIEKNINMALLFIQRIIAGSLSLKIFVNEFVEHLYNLYVIKNFENPMDILDLGEDYREKNYNQAGLISSNELEYLINLFSDLLKQLKWSESSKTFFKAAVIKAVNLKQVGEEQLSRKLKNIDLEIERLNEKIMQLSDYNSLNDRKEKIKGFKEVKTYENEVKNYENEVKIFKNKVRTSEVDKIKDTEESIKKDIGKETIEIKKTPVRKKESEALKDRPVIETEQQEEKEKYENLICSNWNNLLLKIKEKNIPIHAMFVETKGFKVKGNSIYFYLEQNKNWHKEHLSKTNNTIIIQELVKEVTEKNFEIIFDLLSEKNKADLDLIINLSKSSELKKDVIKDADIRHEKLADDEFEEIDKYIEEKFEIKEK